MPEFFRVREAFAFTSKSGVPRVLAPGELISSDDPDLKGREQFCEPVGDYVARANAAVGLETTTAGPGELRAVSHPRGRRKPDEKSVVPTPPEGDV